MNKEMIISSTGHDTRVAILEEDQVVEIFIERENQRGVVGNIYKGRVSKVLPGMQSSFVDIGLERDAFLYVSEVVNTVEEFERLAGEDEDDSAAIPVEIGAAAAEKALRVDAAEEASIEIAPNPLPTAASSAADAIAPAAAPIASRPPARGRPAVNPGTIAPRPGSKIC